MVELTAFLAFSLSVSVADAAALASLPRTGQTACWDSNGNPIACAGTGQDGEKQTGVALPAPRFTDNGNGTIRDNLTGLVWLKKANCFADQDWTHALDKVKTLASGACGLTDGSKAGGWRLPNRKEMLSLLNRQQGDSITYLSSIGFTSIHQPIADDEQYWTSTTSAADSTLVWSINFSDSSIGNKPKTYLGYIWPVRDGQ